MSMSNVCWPSKNLNFWVIKNYFSIWPLFQFPSPICLSTLDKIRYLFQRFCYTDTMSLESKCLVWQISLFIISRPKCKKIELLNSLLVLEAVPNYTIFRPPGKLGKIKFLVECLLKVHLTFNLKNPEVLLLIVLKQRPRSYTCNSPMIRK